MVVKDNRKSIVVSVSMPQEMLDRIDALTDDRYPNRSKVFRELVQRWFDDLDGKPVLPFGDTGLG